MSFSLFLLSRQRRALPCCNGGRHLAWLSQAAGVQKVFPANFARVFGRGNC